MSFRAAPECKRKRNQRLALRAHFLCHIFLWGHNYLFLLVFYIEVAPKERMNRENTVTRQIPWPAITFSFFGPVRNLYASRESRCTECYFPYPWTTPNKNKDKEVQGKGNARSASTLCPRTGHFNLFSLGTLTKKKKRKRTYVPRQLRDWEPVLVCVNLMNGGCQ